jgi:hypothetical protein
LELEWAALRRSNRDAENLGGLFEKLLNCVPDDSIKVHCPETIANHPILSIPELPITVRLWNLSLDKLTQKASASTPVPTGGRILEC